MCDFLFLLDILSTQEEVIVNLFGHYLILEEVKMANIYFYY